MLKNVLHLYLVSVLLFALASIAVPQSVFGSSKLNRDSLVAKINRQIINYPQEKIHVHTDKSDYISGERVWFRAHLVDAYTHLYDTTSLYVYGELINPLDSVVSRVRIKNVDGAFAGYIQLDEALPGGTYNMRFYTRFLENLGEDYFFSKSINVGTPSSLKYKTAINADYEKNSERVNLQMSFIDINTNTKISPKNIVVANDKETFSLRGTTLAKRLRLNKEQEANYSINLKKEPSKWIYIEYEVDGEICSEFVSIPIAEDDFHVDFFPEGGNLLSNVSTNIAFKALSSNGLSTNITGSVYTDTGDTIVRFSTIAKGMGAFYFIGETAKKYYALCRNEKGMVKTFELPTPVVEGYTLSVRNANEVVYVSLASATVIPDNFTLLIHTRGQVLYAEGWDEERTTIMIPKEKLPLGIMQCLLLDQNGLPISERLFFNLNKEILPEIVQTNNKQKYYKRDLVVTSFDIKDVNGDPVNGNFSLSVTDDKDVRVDSTQNILTSLLLTSELKGYIEDPSYYLEGTKISNYVLDLLMQTQGWRRYDMKKVLVDSLEIPSIPVEYIYAISGDVKGGFFLNKKSKNTYVSMIDFKSGASMTTFTDDDGRFSFEALFPDSLEAVVYTVTDKGSSRLDLTLDQEEFPSIESNLIYPKEGNPLFIDYLEKADVKYTLENGIREIHLKDVEIVADKKEPKNTSMFSSPFHTSIDVDMMRRNKVNRLKDILMRSGVRIVTDIYKNKDYAYIRGNKDPALVLLNDIKDDMILTLNPYIDEIETIELAKDGMAAIFGINGGGGAILITSKKGGFNTSPPPTNIKRINPLGYQAYAEFYSPKYETQEERDDERLDLRSTLYWHPNVKVVDGKVQVKFYTADEPSRYSVFIDGLTDNGEPLHIINTIGK